MAAIVLETSDHIATLTLNRPEHRNTISQAMLDQLSAALLAADANRDVRAIVITGAGPTFCAGLDLNDAASAQGVGKSGFGLDIRLDSRNFPPCVLFQLDTPTLCAINGGAAGFGLDLALGCDIRIAARSSKLAAAFTRRGVLPESGGTWHLPRLLGWARAAEIVFTGKTLAADEALALGLVNRVVADENLLAAAQATAQEIADSAPLAVQSAKRMMRAGLSEDFDQHVQRVYLQTLPLLQSDDFKEGFQSFLEKRSPDFQGG